MKRICKFTGALLIALLLINMLVPSFFPEGISPIVHAANKGGKVDGLTWEIDSKGLLTVSGNGNITAHKGKTGIPWLTSANEIKSAKINITGMTDASYLFYGLNKLESVDTTGLIMTNLTDMSYMFSGCTSLKEVTTKSWNTSKVTDMEGLFENCSGLVKLTTDFNTSSVTNMKRMFAGCTSLSTFDVKNFNVTNVRNMSEMFAGCNMKSIDVSRWKTPNVNYIDGMFKDCTNLLSFSFSSWDTSRCVSMESMFRNCRALSNITFGGIDTSNVISFANTFSGCEKLTDLSLSVFDTRSAQTMAGMFAGCKGLTRLDLSKFDTHNVTDMSAMFNNCTNLYYIALDGFNVRRVENAAEMFKNCEKLEIADLAKWDTAALTKIDSMFMNCAVLSTEITFAAKVASSKDCFVNAATRSGSEIVVRYRDECTAEIAKTIVETKSSNSNIKLKAGVVNATIFYDPNGGEMITKYKSYVMGEEVGKLASDARRAGYKFAGWYDDKKEGKRYYSTTIGEGNVTLYAHWTKVTVGKPTSLSLTARYRKCVTVSWKAPKSGATAYQVEISTSRNMTNGAIYPASKLSRVFTGLTSGRTYYFRVRGWKLDSTGKRVYSSWTAVKGVRVR